MAEQKTPDIIFWKQAELEQVAPAIEACQASKASCSTTISSQLNYQISWPDFPVR